VIQLDAPFVHVRNVYPKLRGMDIVFAVSSNHMNLPMNLDDTILRILPVCC
jgi:hypothetical protein